MPHAASHPSPAPGVLVQGVVGYVVPVRLLVDADGQVVADPGLGHLTHGYDGVHQEQAVAVVPPGPSVMVVFGQGRDQRDQGVPLGGGSNVLGHDHSEPVPQVAAFLGAARLDLHRPIRGLTGVSGADALLQGGHALSEGVASRCLLAEHGHILHLHLSTRPPVAFKRVLSLVQAVGRSPDQAGGRLYHLKLSPRRLSVDVSSTNLSRVSTASATIS